jgi:hypothetical protein
MTIWFCVKTAQTPNTVAEVICTFNTFEEQTSNDKCTWFIEKGKELEDVKNELEALGNMVKQIANSESYKEMADGIMEQVADKLAKNPEFAEKFKKDSEKLKSGYIKPKK